MNKQALKDRRSPRELCHDKLIAHRGVPSEICASRDRSWDRQRHEDHDVENPVSDRAETPLINNRSRELCREFVQLDCKPNKLFHCAPPVKV